MQGSGAVGQAAHGQVERPQSYMVHSIILMLLLLVPPSLLLGASKLFEVWRILTGPAVISEVPAWWRALMEFLKALVGIMGVFMPFLAIIKSAQVNARYDRGDYLGAESASRKAASYSKQSIIFLIVVLLVIATDVFLYLAS